MNRALQSNFLCNGDYHRDGTLKIIFSCSYTYPEGVANEELEFIDGTTSHPDYKSITVVGANRLRFGGKATLLDGWLGITGFLKDSSDNSRCWPITIIRKRTSDNIDWTRYEFSLDEALQAPPELVSRIRIDKYLGPRLPEKFSQFKNLTHLSIFGRRAESVMLQQLPEEIGEFGRLKYLTITGTLLERVPSGIFQLPNLETLYLHDNRLKQVPDSINLPKLMAAEFGNNQLTTLPVSLTHSKELWRLALENNPLGITATRVR